MRIAFALLVFCNIHLVFSQAPIKHEQAFITLKDGSMFKAEIIRYEQEYIEILILTGDTIKLHRSAIAKMIREEDHFVFPKSKFHFKKGLFAHLGLGLSADNEVTAQSDLLLGYRIKPRIAIGLGSGFTISDADVGLNWLTHTSLNTFGYGRYYLTNGRWRLFADAKAGYGFARQRRWNNQHSGGFYGQPGIGIHFSSRSKFKWHIGLSQYIYHTTGESVDTDPFGFRVLNNYNLWYNRTLFKIGFEFN